MARLTIVFGLMLCAATLAALLAIQQQRITTAFVPMIFGIPIFICGIISLNPHRVRLWITLAGLIAAIGAAGSITRMVIVSNRWFNGGEIFPVPLTITTILAIVLTAYAFVALRSFRHQTSQ